MGEDPGRLEKLLKIARYGPSRDKEGFSVAIYLSQGRQLMVFVMEGRQQDRD